MIIMNAFSKWENFFQLIGVLLVFLFVLVITYFTTRWIAQYQQGENTILGKEYEETGINLSGGEWQRVILASAYMGEPEILLLDEPSASIDSLKENAMLENLKNELRGKTAILISHRIAFARLADRIIMMKD